jgi:hypothetical protein
VSALRYAAHAASAPAHVGRHSSEAQAGIAGLHLLRSAGRQLHTPGCSRRWTRTLLASLERAGLAGSVHVDGQRKLWHVSERGTALLARLPDPPHERPKVLTAAQARGQLWRHTLAVNEVGITFLRAARARGDEFGPLSWRHEVAHRLGPPRRGRRLLVADALITYGDTRTIRARTSARAHPPIRRSRRAFLARKTPTRASSAGRRTRSARASRIAWGVGASGAR